MSQKPCKCVHSLYYTDDRHILEHLEHILYAPYE